MLFLNALDNRIPRGELLWCSLEPLISLDLVGTKLYSFKARVYCCYCLYIIFSANPLRCSKELRGNLHAKRSGMLVGGHWFKPIKENNLGVTQGLCDLNYQPVFRKGTLAGRPYPTDASFVSWQEHFKPILSCQFDPTQTLIVSRGFLKSCMT